VSIGGDSHKTKTAKMLMCMVPNEAKFLFKGMQSAAAAAHLQLAVRKACFSLGLLTSLLLRLRYKHLPI